MILLCPQRAGLQDLLKCFQCVYYNINFLFIKTPEGKVLGGGDILYALMFGIVKYLWEISLYRQPVSFTSI
jgi:hypothetical protein